MTHINTAHLRNCKIWMNPGSTLTAVARLIHNTQLPQPARHHRILAQHPAWDIIPYRSRLALLSQCIVHWCSSSATRAVRHSQQRPTVQHRPSPIPSPPSNHGRQDSRLHAAKRHSTPLQHGNLSRTLHGLFPSLHCTRHCHAFISRHSLARVHLKALR